MRILVTGAAGFIGSHVCERLLSDGHEVIGIDDLSTGTTANLDHLEVRLVTGSILDPDALADAAAGAQSIVHLAARPSVPRSIDDPVASHEANTVGTMRVLEQARRLDDAHVIVASSSSVYGANPELPKHEGLATLPRSPYAASKLATEQYALAWQHSFGLRTLAFRFFNVYGPRQQPGHAYAAVVPAFVDAALRNEPLTVHGDGSQTRDFTYVGTVSEIIADAVDRGVTWHTPVNLAFGSRTSLLALIEMIETQTGRPAERLHVDPRPGDVPHSQADNHLLRSLFPDATAADLEVGLSETIEWMAAREQP
ncbi:MAG: NAD-dependent epimerase/dehydratase family protein [Ilumatobacteraceae bacterium]